MNIVEIIRILWSIVKNKILANRLFPSLTFKVIIESEKDSHSVMSYSLRPRGLYSPWNSPGQNTGVGSPSLLHGIFPTQELNWSFTHKKTNTPPHTHTHMRTSKVVLVVNNLPANARDLRDVGLTLGSGRSPGGWHGNAFQYSCLKNPMDRGGWQATVHKVAQSDTNEATYTHERQMT